MIVKSNTILIKELLLSSPLYNVHRLLDVISSRIYVHLNFEFQSISSKQVELVYFVPMYRPKVITALTDNGISASRSRLITEPLCPFDGHGRLLSFYSVIPTEKHPIRKPSPVKLME